MSNITSTINAWADGRLSDDELVEALSAHTYKKPSRYDAAPDDPFEAEAWEEGEYDEEGTWDEVRVHVDRGVLPPALYQRIVGEMDAARHAG